MAFFDADAPKPGSTGLHGAEVWARARTEISRAVVDARGDGQVIVATDDDGRRGAMMTALEDLNGCRVVHALGARSALSALDGYQAQVLVLDEDLPDLDSVAVLGQAQARRTGVESVIVSASPTLESVSAAFDIDASDYLVQPPRDLAELRKSVGAILRRLALTRMFQRHRSMLQEIAAQLFEVAGPVEAARIGVYGLSAPAIDALRPGPIRVAVIDERDTLQFLQSAGVDVLAVERPVRLAVASGDVDLVVAPAELGRAAMSDLLFYAQARADGPHPVLLGSFLDLDAAIASLRARGTHLTTRPLRGTQALNLLTRAAQRRRAEAAANALDRLLATLEIAF